MPSTKLWTEVTLSEHDHERAALHFIRERFPDREPFRAWANFTFLGEDGTRNEVDLLVVSPTGAYLVEIKSYPGGRIDGDAATWTWTRPDGSRRTFDHPIRLTERKAKKLKSLLMRQPAFRTPRMRGESFYLRSAVFLSTPGLVVNLDGPGAVDVYGPGQDEHEEPKPNQLDGLIQVFTRVDPRRGRQIDRPLSKAIAQAVDQAGIRESTTHRRVGDYQLGELLAEGEGWQDFATKHHVTSAPRRIRIYLTGSALDESERQSLRRAAEREFKLLEGIHEQGIERPLELMAGNPMGPALIFEHDPDAERLDHWLDDHRDDLSFRDRVRLVRDLGEVLRIAHRHSLCHRGLSPASVWVSGSGASRKLRIRDWHTATREQASRTTLTATQHLGDRVAHEGHVYLAPEALRVANPAPVPADIWSLGAIAYRILTGSDPAPDVTSLYDTLREQGSLTLASVLEAPPQQFDGVVRTATSVNATDRFVSVDEFLQFLDFAQKEAQEKEKPDPLEAKAGDLLEAPDGRVWLVDRRVGRGSTSVVLVAEAEDGDRREVLKVARSDEHAERVRIEWEVLQRLRDRTIIEPYGLDKIGGRTVLRLEEASKTLSHVLHTDGSLSLDLLERYGGDLLDALVFLDREGVAHRDIKPDNLGIAPRGKDNQRRLVLFDFSLSHSDPRELHVGTAGYLDPFLEERTPRRWDEQAERYSAAVTLHEMATGLRPEWGDGTTDPALTDLQLPTLRTDLFDPAVRESLEEFFEKALHRRPEERFDTAAQMRQAWQRVFETTAHAEVGGDGEFVVAELELDTVKAGTSLLELGIPAKVRNALDRMGVITAGDLADYPPAELVRLGGVGAATRRKINELAQALRRRLARGEQGATVAGASVDQLAEALVPRGNVDAAHAAAVAALLGLGPMAEATWPTQLDASAESGLDRADLASVVSSARGRWKRQPALTPVRQEIFDALLANGGALGGEELAALLLAARGSLASEPLRSRRARAVVRAAVEAESTLERPRYVVRRLGQAFLVLLQGDHAVDERDVDWDPDPLLDYAALLAAEAEVLADTVPLPTTEAVQRALQEVERPADLPPIDIVRTIRLAAAASGTTAVSARLELYPIGMGPERALAECRATLLDRRGLEEAEVRRRVRARFPDAADLPPRPQLDSLMERIGLEWGTFERPDGSTPSGYLVPRRGGVLRTTMASSLASTTFASPDDAEIVRRQTDHRLATFRANGGFLALTVDRRYLSDASEAVARAVDAEVWSVDRLLIQEMRSLAERSNARWDRLLQADNERGAVGWTRLGQVIDRVMEPVREKIASHEGRLVLVDVGLLIRYGHAGYLATLRDQLTRSTQSVALQGAVLVVPGSDPTARPVVDGEAIPVVTANQWDHLSTAWLKTQLDPRAA
ncbi:BREX system serine/threonine kinase PglW [Gemmatimonadota bacterium Y43]|uniref:BREX system serine/threonine kinase PglW n=1 Tax=Gaopeijia maritima TaxID=3119007 RepID=UPI003275AE7A